MNLQLINLYKLFKNLKFIPSLPYTPIPTLAHFIMLTSFPPSPIARTIFFKHFLIVDTTCAFYEGDDLLNSNLPIYYNRFKIMY